MIFQVTVEFCNIFRSFRRSVLPVFTWFLFMRHTSKKNEKKFKNNMLYQYYFIRGTLKITLEGPFKNFRKEVCLFVEVKWGAEQFTTDKMKFSMGGLQ